MWAVTRNDRCYRTRKQRLCDFQLAEPLCARKGLDFLGVYKSGRQLLSQGCGRSSRGPSLQERGLGIAPLLQRLGKRTRAQTRTLVALARGEGVAETLIYSGSWLGTVKLSCLFLLAVSVHAGRVTFHTYTARDTAEQVPG